MSNLLLNEVPLMCQPSLATKIGLNEAIFIQQLHYWLNRSTNYIDNRIWVYNTIDDWHKQFPFCWFTIDVRQKSYIYFFIFNLIKGYFYV